MLRARPFVPAFLVAAAVAALVPASAQADPPASYGQLAPVRTGARVLRHGASGAIVGALQDALVAAGLSVQVTRVFDWETWAAVRHFQGREGCFVDGVVGRETMRALDRVLASSTPPTPPPPPPAPPPTTTAPGIPARQAGALTGSQFMDATRGLSRAAREVRIREELLAGNVPDFLRRLCPIGAGSGLSGAVGGAARLVVQVLPDYLALGTDADFVRIPMGGPTAQAVADAWGYRLPTRKLVNLIYRQATVKLTPIPLPPTSQMMSNEWIETHQARVEAQRRGQPLGALTAGHKKDVVSTGLLRSRPGKVAIYGWHQADGSPIQGLSTVHEATYSDYSHGVRLVHPDCTLDGAPARLVDVLSHLVDSALVSDEGPIGDVRY